jgi:D-alanyl-D-alanine dipeptidase
MTDYEELIQFSHPQYKSKRQTEQNLRLLLVEQMRELQEALYELNRQPPTLLVFQCR